MPVLIHTIAEDFDKLLENGGLATIALLSELGRVMIVAIDVAFVFVVAVRCTKDGRADTAGEVLNVVFAIEGSDVRAPQRAPTRVAEEVEAAEVVGLTQRVLVRWVIGYGEEFGSDDLATVLEEWSAKTIHQITSHGDTDITRETFQMIRISQRAHKLAGQGPRTFAAYPLLSAGPPPCSWSFLHITARVGLLIPAVLWLARIHESIRLCGG